MFGVDLFEVEFCVKYVLTDFRMVLIVNFVLPKPSTKIHYETTDKNPTETKTYFGAYNLGTENPRQFKNREGDRGRRTTEPFCFVFRTENLSA